MIHGSPDLSWTQVPFWIGHILQDAETVNLFDVPGAKIQEKSDQSESHQQFQRFHWKQGF